MNASREGCTEDLQDDGTLHTKSVPRQLSYEFVEYAADYKVILHGAVALKAMTHNLDGEQTHQESGLCELNDLIFRFDGSEAGVQEALLLQTHYREGYGNISEADLGNKYGNPLSLHRFFEAFLESKRLLLDEGQKLRYVVLYTNRGASSDLESQFVEIVNEDLEFPLKQLLVMDGFDSQKFYKFQRPESYDLGSFCVMPRIIQWWLIRNHGQFDSLKLVFLKSLVFAVQQPDAEQLLKIQRDTISGMRLCENVSEQDRNLILQVFHDSIRSWMEVKDGEEVRAWTDKRTERCLQEAKAKVMLSLETGPGSGPVTEHHQDVLIAATLTGHALAVETLLRKGCNVNATTREGRTLLHEATDRGHTDVVKVLLAQGCDVDALEHRRNRSAIHIAASKDLLPIASLLLEHGCDTDLGVRRGLKPLHLAAEEGLLGMAQLLVDKGCDVNTLNDRGETALHLAVLTGRRDVVELLLDVGCDATAVDENGATPLYLAATKGHVEVIRLLIQKESPRSDPVARAGSTTVRKEESSDRPAIQIGASRALLAIATSLQEQGRSTSLGVWRGLKPLDLAAEKGLPGMLQLLADKGCDVGARTETELHLAVLKGRCDETAADKNGAKPLYLAAREGRLEVTRLLITNGRFSDAVTKSKPGESESSQSDSETEAGPYTRYYEVPGRLDPVKILQDVGCDVTLYSVESLEFESLLLEDSGDEDADGSTVLHMKATLPFSGHMKVFYAFMYSFGGVTFTNY